MEHKEDGIMMIESSLVEIAYKKALKTLTYMVPKGPGNRRKAPKSPSLGDNVKKQRKLINGS